MTRKLCSMLAGASLLAFAGGAHAASPTVLSNSQMDGVTAGASAVANAGALALGDFDAFTQTITATNAVASNRVGTTFIPGVAIGQSFSAAAAASALFQAAVAVTSSSSASLP